MSSDLSLIVALLVEAVVAFWRMPIFPELSVYLHGSHELGLSVILYSHNALACVLEAFATPWQLL